MRKRKFKRQYVTSKKTSSVTASHENGLVFVKKHFAKTKGTISSLRDVS